MEPQRITYKVLIDLEDKPISYKTFETICGDTYKYAKRCPTPVKLAADIHLDAGHFQISQVLGDNSEHFRFTSLTNYYQETLVAEQAQKDWYQSRILQLFKTGEIVRGRFGYQEVETGYITLLGACGQTDHVYQGVNPIKIESIEVQTANFPSYNCNRISPEWHIACLRV